MAHVIFVEKQVELFEGFSDEHVAELWAKRHALNAHREKIESDFKKISSITNAIWKEDYIDGYDANRKLWILGIDDYFNCAIEKYEKKKIPPPIMKAVCKSIKRMQKTAERTDFFDDELETEEEIFREVAAVLEQLQ